MKEGPPRIDRLLTVSEAAQLLRVHPVTLYEWVSAGRVPSIKLGRKRLFDPRELQRWLAQQAEPERGRRRGAQTEEE